MGEKRGYGGWGLYLFRMLFIYVACCLSKSYAICSITADLKDMSMFESRYSYYPGSCKRG